MNQNIRRLLFVSLMLNLLCFGVIGGYFLRVFMPPHPRFQAMHKELSQILPKEKLDAFEKSMQRNFEKNRDILPKLEAAHNKIEHIMTAPTFDKEAFRTQLKELDTLHASTFKGMGQSLLELLPTLTLEERRKLAAHLKKNRPPMGPGRMLPGKMPPPGFPPPRLTEKQKQVIDRCLGEAGVVPSPFKD